MDKYNISLWETFPRSESLLLENCALVETETRAPIYFYFQYPTLSDNDLATYTQRSSSPYRTFGKVNKTSVADAGASWYYNRARVRRRLFEAQDGLELVLHCDNIAALNTRGYGLVLSNKKLSPFLENFDIASGSNKPYEIIKNDIIYLDNTPFKYNGYDFNLYYKGVEDGYTYNAIKVWDSAKQEIQTLQLGKVTSGLIWAITLKLTTLNGDKITKLIAIYNIKNGVDLALTYLQDVLNNNTTPSSRIEWLVSDVYAYAPYGLNLIDLPSNANEIFENNNQLLFTQKNYTCQTKTITFSPGSRIYKTVNGQREYYTIIDIIGGIQTNAGSVKYKTLAVKDGETDITKITNFSDTYGVYEFFDEKRRFTISCDDMRSLSRGREPSLKVNINGTKTFTFKMYYYYIDDETGEEVKNPYVDQIFNESRIKVWWYGDWYDFIVKNIVEDTASYSITYTCKDLFIYELSKNGYGLEFQDELMNNQGDIFELGKKTVEGTDWQIIDDEATIEPKSDHIYQYLEEPLCLLGNIPNITQSVTIFGDDLPGGSMVVPASEVAIFYSQFGKTTDLECLYPYSEANAEKNRDGLVIKNKDIKQYTLGLSQEYSDALNINIPWRGRRKITSVKTAYDSIVKKNVLIYEKNGQTYHGWTETKFKNPASVQNLFVNYKDFKRIDGWFINSENNYNLMYDPDLSFMTEAITSDSANLNKFKNLLEDLRISGTLLIGKTTGQVFEVNSYIYKKSGDTYLSEYQLSGSSVKTSSGNVVLSLQNTDTGEIEVVEKRPNEDLTDFVGFKQNTKSYIPIPPRIAIYNKGLYMNAHYLDEGIQENQVYVLRYKAQINDNGTWRYSQGRGLKLQLATNYSEETTILEYIAPNGTDGSYYDSETKYRYDFYKANKSVIREEIVSEHMTFALYGDNSTASAEWRIEEIEFFPLYKTLKKGEEVILLPGEIETDALYQTFYYFYNTDNNKLATNREEIRFTYSAPIGKYYAYKTYDSLISINGIGLTPIITSNKITSISQKESNRYNIIQALCEKFQCWARFYIRHDKDSGRILTPLDISESDPLPIKYILFKEDLTQNKGLAFTDGLDLISINKTLQSDNIATQLYVKPNITDAVDGGIVTIATSPLNPARDTYILNFDFFVENGMINLSELVQDQSNFYAYISRINTEYDELEKERTKLLAELDSTLALETVYKNYAPEVENQLTQNKNDIVFFVNGARDKNDAIISCSSYYSALNYIFNRNFKNRAIPSKIVTLLIANLTLGAQAREGKEKLKEIQDKIGILRARIAPIEYRIKDLLMLRQVNQKNFVQKYGQFIFEGVWESSDYVDADKYYYDAVNVSSTSARPTISYTFNVMRLGALEEYNTRQFEVGDIGYVQDSKLLGYKADGVTPIKEKVVISEITYFFDESDKDKITVQNYRTQFEDLMSRIVAQVQTPKYAPAAYDTTTRATVITPNLPTYK